MLATYFKEPRTLAVFRCGPAGSQLDRFIIWLEIRGYRPGQIDRIATWQSIMKSNQSLRTPLPWVPAGRA